jgi:DNA repair protein RecO (recombination protein O)
LVLRTFDQGESDRLVHLFTADLGRVSAIAKGARRSRRRFPGTLELFSVLDVRLVDPPRAALMRLEGARLVASYEGLTADLRRYAIGCQLLELLNRLTGERQPNPDLLRFSLGVLETLAGEQPDRLLALLVLAKTLARLGYRPQLASCTLCGAPLDAASRVAFEPRHGGGVCARCLSSDALGAGEGGRPLTVPARVLHALDAGIRTPLLQRSSLGLAEPDVRRLEKMMRRFFQFHIGFELRTAQFLVEALEYGRVDESSNGRDTARDAPSQRVRTRTLHPQRAGLPPDPERGT